ncbi:MAG: hypothetical protein GY730_03820 [bacterium]|nr:hypothetical protein [bacterium]
MAGGIYFLLKNRKNLKLLLNQKVCYIGPGTGLGGGFAKINSTGTPLFNTDGHISDIIIIDNKKNIHKAEEVLCGTALYNRTGHHPVEINRSQKLLNSFRTEIKLMGSYLAILIKSIFLGNINKYNAADNWPDKDINFARGITTFLIGGSFGTKGKISEIIYAEAKKELSQQGLGHLHILKIPEADKAALLGGLNFIDIKSIVRKYY